MGHRTFYRAQAVAIGLMWVTHACRPAAQPMSDVLAEGQSTKSDDIWMMLGDAKPSGTDLVLSVPSSAEEANICAIADGSDESQGLCYAAEPDGVAGANKRFVIRDFVVTEKMTIKIRSIDTNQTELYRKVRFKPVGASSEPVTTPSNPPTDTPTTTPATTSTALPSGMDLSLSTVDGGTKKVSDVFKKDYLVVELSAYDCGPCRSFATGWNQTAAQWESYFSPASKCDKLVLVGNYGGLRGRLADWQQMLGKSSFVGRSSYGTSVDLGQAAKALGFNKSFGIPTLFVVDRSGQLVDSATLAVPNKVREICGP